MSRGRGQHLQELSEVNETLRNWTQNQYLLNADDDLFGLDSVDAIQGVLADGKEQDDPSIPGMQTQELPFPFVRTELLSSFSKLLERTEYGILYVTGPNRASKSFLLNQFARMHMSKPSQPDTTYHFVTVKMLEVLTDIRMKERMLQWLESIGDFKDKECLSPWIAAVNRVIPKSLDAKGKSVVIIEDVSGNPDTAMAMVKELIRRSNTVVTFPLPPQMNVADYGMDSASAASFEVGNYTEHEVKRLLGELIKTDGLLCHVEESIFLEHLFFEELEGQELAIMQTLGWLKHTNRCVWLPGYSGGKRQLQSYVWDLTKQRKALELFNFSGIFSFPREQRPCLATTTVILNGLEKRGLVEGLAVRLLGILVVMQAPLVPVDKLYYIITCTDGAGFRDREPFQEAIALLQSLMLVRIRSDRLQVYDCVRIHPKFWKAKGDMKKYLRSDPRLSFHFLEYVRETLSSDRWSATPADVSMEPWAASWRDEEVGALSKDDPSGNTKRQHSHILLITLLIMVITLAHSVFFTHILRVDTMFSISSDPAQCDTSKDHLNVPNMIEYEWKNPMSLPTNNTSVCKSLIPEEYKGYRQLEFLFPITEVSVHRILKLSSARAINLFINVDALCRCRNGYPLELVTLPSIRYLYVSNARKCNMPFWRFNVSMPNLSTLALDNMDLRGEKYMTLMSFLEPSFRTLKSMTIERSDVNKDYLPHLEKTTDLHYLSVNNITIKSP